MTTTTIKCVLQDAIDEYSNPANFPDHAVFASAILHAMALELGISVTDTHKAALAATYTDAPDAPAPPVHRLVRTAKK